MSERATSPPLSTSIPWPSARGAARWHTVSPTAARADRAGGSGVAGVSLEVRLDQRLTLNLRSRVSH